MGKTKFVKLSKMAKELGYETSEPVYKKLHDKIPVYKIGKYRVIKREDYEKAMKILIKEY